MTTIAISGGVVAADTQATGGNYTVRMQKLARLPDGGVAVIAGSAADGYAALRWLMDGERGDGPEIDGSTIVIVRPDKSIWIADGQWPAFPILDDTYASGCGQDLARLLMAQGKTPVEAVAEACEHDAASSGPIFSMTVYPPRGEGLEVFDVTRHRRKRK
jgi:20S proteasome alpha/beta subunit